MSRRAACAAHGLDYDARSPAGCVLCVRERAAAAAAQRGGRWSLALLLCALGLSAGAVALAARGGTPEPLGAPPTRAATPETVAPAAAPAAEISASNAIAKAESVVLRGPAPDEAGDARGAVRERPASATAPARAAKAARKHRAAPAARAPGPRLGPRSVPVTMYKTSWCGACKRAAAYMQRAGIAVREHDVERDPEARARSRRLNPRGTVPTIDVDGSVLVGWSEPRFEALLAEAAARRAR